MDANQQREQEQIRTFRSVTGAPESVARKFLEEAVWDLNVKHFILFYFLSYLFIHFCFSLLHQISTTVTKLKLIIT